MAKYDVVVVGAGNAGLTAALRTAKAGKKTLLIEQHNLPGGCATSFVRGRFEFDPSLHELCGVGTKENPGDLRPLFEQYGLDMDWRQIDDCFRVITKYTDGSDMDVTMPSGSKEAFIAKMEEYVPKSRPSMEKLFALLEEIVEGLAYLSSGSSDSNVLRKKYPNLLRTGAHQSLEVLKALKLPQKCIDILSTYWSYLGVDLAHLSFLHYASMIYGYIVKGAHIPAHTSHQISVSLLEKFKELGGETWFNCRAERFLFDGDKCCGVETTLGTIDCDYVIANINPDIIYGKMMPPELIPEREKKLSTARNKDYGARMISIQMGINKSAEELGIKDYSIFLSGTSDSQKEAASLEKFSTNEYLIFLCHNIVIPDFSPKGTCVCSFTTMTGAQEWNSLSQEDYFKFKNTIAKKMLGLFYKKTGIDLAPYIEEIAVSTPLTFSRYLGVPEGSVYGYKTKDWDGIIPRMMMLKEDYPIKGLCPVGTSGPRGDGYSSTYYAGQLLADIVLGKMAKGVDAE